MSDPQDHEREDADLAAEYVLGTLDGAARRSAERRAAHDPAFAAEIDVWAERLAPLTAAIPEAEPPVGLWQRIAADLDHMTRRAPGSASEAVRPRGRRVSGIWQWIGLAGIGLAAASLAALIVVAAGIGEFGAMGPGPGLPGTFTATLSAENGSPLATIVIDSVNGQATFVPVANPDGGGRVPELWLVPQGGAPRSLGLLDMSRPLRLEIKSRAIADPNAALAVSMEPEGGSPTGRPTGPVVASGALHSI
ncbi:anti-sigma factor domain-containing protein [Aurantimonas sp. VKM B-3413]|uniref:anti-sigma factor n=1 Tax=Aurantimonas sp. VKM B-3413 TaxID=2779401 RepID=UPI001E424213|nr:anti-sigma factor [Aurantimonas sp. VKM B-3413]MCB8840798.1 anti-sigma factor [Aurantimonas sp. VKM B-3413]